MIVSYLPGMVGRVLGGVTVVGLTILVTIVYFNRNPVEFVCSFGDVTK